MGIQWPQDGIYINILPGQHHGDSRKCFCFCTNHYFLGLSNETYKQLWKITIFHAQINYFDWAILNSKLFVYQRVHTVFDFAPGFVEKSIVIHVTDHSNRSEFLTLLNKVEDCSSHPPNNMIVIGYHQQILTIYHLLIHEYTLIIVTTMSGLQLTHPIGPFGSLAEVICFKN